MQMQMGGDIGGPRGCGDSREEGALYIEVPLAPFGVPLESFIVDPPRRFVEVGGEKMPIEEAFDVAAVGMVPVQNPADGVYHFFDHVGEGPYPNVADYLEEVRRQGDSRKISWQNRDFLSKLGPRSRMLKLHRRAYIGNAEEYYAAEAGIARPCPKAVVGHAPAGDIPPAEMCARLWWQDITGGEVYEPPRAVRRQIGSTTYHAYRRPHRVEPVYATAIFMSLPIANLAVVRAEDGSHEPVLEAAQISGLPVRLADH